MSACVCVQACGAHLLVLMCMCHFVLSLPIRNELVVIWELNLEERGISKVSGSVLAGLLCLSTVP